MADAFDSPAGLGPPQPEPEPEPEPLAADGDRAGVPAGGTALDSASPAAQADAEKIELLAHRTELQQQLQAAEEQLKSYHPTDFASPQATSIDDMVGMNLTLFRSDTPTTVLVLLKICYARLLVDSGTVLASGFGVGPRCPRRIQVTL